MSHLKAFGIAIVTITVVMGWLFVNILLWQGWVGSQVLALVGTLVTAALLPGLAISLFLDWRAKRKAEDDYDPYD